MFLRKARLKLRRVFRRQKRYLIDVGDNTSSSFDRNIIRRLVRLAGVKRFVAGWIGLILLVSVAVVLQTVSLSSKFEEVKPVSGGTYREGIVGSFNNANPIYAQTDVDVSVSRLVFSGLFKYGTEGKLEKDIVESYKTDKSEKIYTMSLRQDVKWHDGQGLTADDVVFTYKTIQDPEAESYLRNNWRGVDVSKKDDYTVVFKLPTALSGFRHSLTTGIIPKHILGEEDPTLLRSSNYNNQSLIGTGPFKFEAVEVDQEIISGTARVAVLKNQDYYQKPAELDSFIVKTYKTSEDMIDGLKSSDIDGMVGLKSVPDDVAEKNDVYTMSLAAEVMSFFKNSHPILKNKTVREALVLGVDKQKIFGQLPVPVANIDGPLLRSHVAYSKAFAQPTNNIKKANRILDKAGWKLDKETGIRKKGKNDLSFKLYSSDNEEFRIVTGVLRDQWREIGADVEVVLNSEEETQTILVNHNYDAIVYGILVGSDPDVYPYWHSSQGKINSPSRLNLSEYNSKQADESLEAGRTRSESRNRTIKYRPFLKAWQNDYPALALYQPQSLYVANSKLNGFEYGVVQNLADRYANVTNWRIKTKTQKIEQ